LTSKSESAIHVSGVVARGRRKIDRRSMNEPKKNDHRASSFRKTDITRMIKAAIAGGIPNPVVEVDLKTKWLRVSGGEAPKAPQSDLDRELAEFDARKAAR